MNPKRNPTVTQNNGFGVSATSGSGIDGYQISLYKHYRTKSGRHVTRYADYNGLIFKDQDDLKKFELEHGYLQYYGRNVITFFSSRAFRKRTGKPYLEAPGNRRKHEHGETVKARVLQDRADAKRIVSVVYRGRRVWGLLNPDGSIQVAPAKTIRTNNDVERGLKPSDENRYSDLDAWTRRMDSLMFMYCK